MSSSHANLLALIGEGNAGIGGVKGSFGALSDSGGSEGGAGASRLIIVSNQLPIRAKKKAQAEPGDVHTWEFEWDEDSLVFQAKAGIEQPQFDNIQASLCRPQWRASACCLTREAADKDSGGPSQVLHVGALGAEVEPSEQEAVSSDLLARFSCLPGARAAGLADYMADEASQRAPPALQCS